MIQFGPVCERDDITHVQIHHSEVKRLCDEMCDEMCVQLCTVTPEAPSNELPQKLHHQPIRSRRGEALAAAVLSL